MLARAVYSPTLDAYLTRIGYLDPVAAPLAMFEKPLRVPDIGWTFGGLFVAPSSRWRWEPY
jgi:hypothetical protein